METKKRSILLSFAGLCSLNIIASIDATALSVSLPTIAAAVDATSVQAYWCGTSFVLSSAVCQPVFAAFSNAFGRKAIILVTLGLFTIGTIICGTAQSTEALLIGRTIQGGGGGGMLTMTYVVMADLLTLRQRANGMAVISLVWLAGTVCGPVLGGGFTTNASWRWIFWICLPFLGISLLLITFFLRTPHKTLHPAQALTKVDWVGAGLFVASLTSFLLSVSWGGSMYAWSSWKTMVPLVLGVTGLVDFMMFEHYVPAHPVVPLTLLGNRTACAAFLGTLMMGIIQFGLLYYLPLYYQVSKHYSPLISGLALLPQCLCSGPTTAFTRAYIPKTGRYRFVIWAGWLVLALGCGLLILLSSQTTVPQWIFINTVSGFGLGALFTSLSVASQAASADANMAIASGLTPFFRAIGQAIGIAIGDAAFQNVLKGRLLNSSSPLLRMQAGSFAKDAGALGGILNGMENGSVEKTELQETFIESLRAIWWTLFAVALLGGLLSLLIKQLSLDRKATVATEAADRKLEKGSVATDDCSKEPAAADEVRSEAGSAALS